MLLLAGLIVLLVAPSPWNWIGFVACLVLWTGEVYLWYRTVRHRRAQVGATTLVGRLAQVITPCRPEGQVSFEGESEIWRARCASGAGRGETVRVVEVDGITLVVEPAN